MATFLSFRHLSTWLFIWLALTIDVMDWQLLSFAASNITKEMGFSLPQMGILLGAPLLGASVSAVFAGWLADRFGRVRTMVACISFFGPYILGWMATVSSMGTAIGTTALLYLLAAVPVLFLPETLVKNQMTGYVKEV